MPSISVILPCHNDAALLRRALHHLGDADEIIVVDNASSDASAAIARQYGATVVDQPLLGITHAMDAGMQHASGEIAVRIDADILPPAGFIQRVRRAWERADEDVVAMSGWGWFDHRPARQSLLYLGAYYCSVGAALGHWPLFGSNCSMRTQWWREVRPDPSDTFVHDDMHLSFRVRPGEKVKFFANPVVMDPRALEGGIRTRFARGWHTIRVNWQHQPPWKRLPERLR
ncbi:glycosyltransferase [Corynebacterium gerontici]|uniref:4,4'-diaponeurosporenoate glycosyltransferase n=1 Tax=Corynebacterium gerontici TaxID=2079234 RepID=A0A3G6IXM5_9CORY|nr:glycosyltransferase family A protein [Corynebacterium gerontici]AZA10525.1 Undecaprenyl-phosphate 4-deoxy-4-formamido-L-arabinose transferase [Corynebacterium gerontici]